MKSRVVIGGGIAGLACAYHLLRQKEKSDVILLEASDKTGGWVCSHPGEYFFEGGPRAIKPTSSLMAFLDQLGLQGEILPAAKTSSYRYIWYGKKLRRISFNPFSMVFSPLLRPLLYALPKLFFQQDAVQEESVASYFERRFNAHTARILAGAMVQGIYAGDPQLLSFPSCFPSLYDLERRYGSLGRGLLAPRKDRVLPGLISFTGGMQRLPDALRQALGGCVRTCEPVVSLKPVGEKIFVTTTRQALLADEVYSAIPAAGLARLFEPLAPFLQGFSNASLTLVHLGFERYACPVKGFGYLLPAGSGHPILGATLDSDTFPQFNQRSQEGRITVMMPYTPQNAQDIAWKNLQKHIPLAVEPDYVKVRHAVDCIPQYTLGHQVRLQALQSHLDRTMPALKLLGSSYTGVAVTHLLKASALAVEPAGISGVEQRRS